MTLGLAIDKKLEKRPASDVRTMNSLPLAVAGEIIMDSQLITDGQLIYCRDDQTRIEY